jgi:hypothetical protein
MITVLLIVFFGIILYSALESVMPDPITWLQEAREQYYLQHYPNGYFFRKDCKYEPNFYYQNKHKQNYVNTQLYSRKLLHSNKLNNDQVL